MKMAAACQLALLFVAAASALVTAEVTKVEHVLLLSPDGMHAVDLTKFVEANPSSTFASLYKTSIRYPNAFAVRPTDSFPSLVGLLTGGTAKTAGIYYESSWCRTCYPPGSVVNSSTTPPGAVVDFSEVISTHDGLTLTGAPINKDALSLDSEGKLIYPWRYVKVNTLLNVVKSLGKRTAWIDKQLGHSWVAGPGGKGCDDCFFPSQDYYPNSKTDLSLAIAYEQTKINALLCQMTGLNSGCQQKAVGVPAFFGATFQVVNSIQKLKGAGYLDAAGNPSPLLEQAFLAQDDILTTLVNGLVATDLLNKTAIIVCAKYGNAPIDPKLLVKIQPDWASLVANITGRADAFAYVDADDIGLLWLTDIKLGPKVGRALATKYKSYVRAESVLYGAAVAQYFTNPLLGTDDRVPDVIVIPTLGTIYTGSATKIEEHGGFSSDDRKVACFVSHPAIKGTTRRDHVSTSRVASTIVELLGAPRTLLTSSEVEAPLPGVEQYLKLTS